MASLGNSSGFTSTPPSFQALLSGASIPQSLIKIPKDQQKLLDRPDSWSIALKGSNEAANVPPEVIQSLKDFHTAHTLPPPAQKPQVSVSSGPSLITPAKLPTANTLSDRGGGSPASSAPGTPVSWSSSPGRPKNSTVQNSSPSLSIRSQIAVESQFPPPSPTAVLPSSPPQCASSPIAPAPKRPDPPAGLPQPNLKRRRIDPFPSSSAGLEDEMETCIPDAIDQATSWVNKAAARLLTASQAVTSPPCGQGSMVPSTYQDAKSPAKSSTPNKRRNMKVISAADWSSSASITADQPIIPLSQPREKSLPASSGLCIASTYATENQTPQDNLVVHDTPGKARTLEEEHQGNQTSLSEANSPDLMTGVDIVMDENTSGKPPPKGTNQDAKTGELVLSDNEKAKNEIRTWLDDVWGAQRLDWLPVALQQRRPDLSRSSLETLKRLTLLAERRGVDLGSLWTEPDGPLYQTSKQNNEELSFPDELSHESIEFLVEAARQVEKKKREKRAASMARATAAARLVQPPTAKKSPCVKVGAGDIDLPKPTLQSGSSHETIAERFMQSPYETFRAEYPSYSGSLMDFVRACMVVEYLQRKQTLPKWLYDDFIRAFGDGYIQYMDRMDKAVPPEKPITAVRWYVGNVDRPVFQKNLVTVESLGRVFEVYLEESKSVRGTISPEVSPSPTIVKSSTVLSMNSLANGSDNSNITSPPPGDCAKSLQDAANMPVLNAAAQARGVPEVQKTSQNKRVHVEEQETEPGFPNPEASSVNPQSSPDNPKSSTVNPQSSPVNPKSSPVNPEECKQKMTDEKTPDKPVPAMPKIQCQRAATHAEDDNVIFVSSNPRQRPALFNGIGQQVSIKQETTKDKTSPLPSRAASQKAPATDQATTASSQTQRIASVAEKPSPAPKTTALSSRANFLRPERPPGRRTLPPSFDFGPPSRQASQSPARSVLSASTQDARVKKAKKTEQERQRDIERWKRKIDRMAKTGRVPGSTPAPTGGGA